MTAVVPSILTDIGIVCGVFTAFCAAVAVAWKTPPVKWFRQQLSESLGDWFETRVQQANAEHHEYVRYHLGPNGTTKPIHQRLCDLERAAGTVDPDDAPLPFVDWHAPYDDVADHIDCGEDD